LSLPVVQAGSRHPKVVHPCGSQLDAPAGTAGGFQDVRNSLSAIAPTRNLQRVRLLSFKTIPYTLTREDSMLKFIA
jgi:hypothetical protein